MRLEESDHLKVQEEDWKVLLKMILSKVILRVVGGLKWLTFVCIGEFLKVISVESSRRLYHQRFM
jgi:hypothetical protein